jgi:hypothetical protein
MSLNAGGWWILRPMPEARRYAPEDSDENAAADSDVAG